MEKKYVVESKYSGYLSMRENNTGIIREFPKIGFKMELTKESLLNISYSPGGRRILENYLVFEDSEVLEFLEIDIEPEDSFTAKDLESLVSNGSLGQLEDALTFSKKGTKEAIKDAAVRLGTKDLGKIDAISKATNSDVLGIIKLNEEVPTEQEATPTSSRRSAPFVPEKTSSSPRYKIVDGVRVKAD